MWRESGCFFDAFFVGITVGLEYLAEFFQQIMSVKAKI